MWRHRDFPAEQMPPDEILSYKGKIEEEHRAKTQIRLQRQAIVDCYMNCDPEVILHVEKRRRKVMKVAGEMTRKYPWLSA